MYLGRIGIAFFADVAGALVGGAVAGVPGALAGVASASVVQLILIGDKGPGDLISGHTLTERDCDRVKYAARLISAQKGATDKYAITSTPFVDRNPTGEKWGYDRGFGSSENSTSEQMGTY